jgi:hypothetical protein
MSETLGPGSKTTVRRLPKKAVYDETTIFSILDEARMCHVAGDVDGLAMALPTLHAREDHTLYLHGNRSNALLHAIVSKGEASVSATIYDGLRLARSGFESSVAYRSVVIVGAVHVVEDADEKRRILDLFVDAVLPGRSREVRPATDAEVARTFVVAMSIDQAVAKVSSGPTDDDIEDQGLPIWSGTVTAKLRFGPLEPSSDGAMASGSLPIPDSVQQLLQQ